MPEQNQPSKTVARQIIDLSTDAIPEFIFERTADKTLSVTVAELNNQVLFGARGDKETAIEALTRLGFVHPVANDS